MIEPVCVEPRAENRIWIQFSDGREGEIDLSNLVGRGTLKAWSKPGCFEKVRIAPHRAIAWDENAELCADALYLELTGKTIE